MAIVPFPAFCWLLEQPQTMPSSLKIKLKNFLDILMKEKHHPMPVFAKK